MSAPPVARRRARPGQRRVERRHPRPPPGAQAPVILHHTPNPRTRDELVCPSLKQAQGFHLEPTMPEPDLEPFQRPAKIPCRMDETPLAGVGFATGWTVGTVPGRSGGRCPSRRPDVGDWAPWSPTKCCVLGRRLEVARARLCRLRCAAERLCFQHHGVRCRCPPMASYSCSEICPGNCLLLSWWACSSLAAAGARGRPRPDGPQQQGEPVS
jgi:hypothetical protein